MELLLGVVVGAVVAWLGPSLVGGVMRPAAKGAIKGSVVAYKAVATAVSEASESVGDMVAEAKAEMSDKAEVAAPAERRGRRK